MNKSHHPRTYQKFCKLYEVVPLAPSVYNLLSFLMHLASFLSAPGSVMNYFISIKSWVESIAGPKRSYQIKVMKQGILKNSLHRVKKALPLTPEDFSTIISFLLVVSPPLLACIAALIIAYATLVRVSNLLASSPDVVTNHTLKFGDVSCCGDTLTLVFHSTKTRFPSAAPSLPP